MPMTTEDPTDDNCDLISTYYSDVCQVMVPSTNQRAYEMCPDVYADLADANGEIVCPVDDTQCYQATLCDGVMGVTYECDDLIAAAENMPAKDLCPCTCAEEVMTTAEPDAGEESDDPEEPSEDLTTEEPDTGEESDDSEEAEEPSDTTTEAVVIPDNTPAPTKEVKVQMKLSMTDEQYEEKKGEVKTSVSKKFEVAENLITINKVAGRRRSLRRILSEVNLEVGIQTHEEDRVTAIIDEADFAADMGERVSAETGLTVTVSEVEKLPTVDVTSGDTAVDDGSDDDTDMTWLWIVLAVVGVLACGGIAYVVINTQDGAQGEKGDIGGEGLGGESLGGEGEETKRSPGAQAMHDKL